MLPLHQPASKLLLLTTLGSLHKASSHHLLCLLDCHCRAVTSEHVDDSVTFPQRTVIKAASCRNLNFPVPKFFERLRECAVTPALYRTDLSPPPLNHTNPGWMSSPCVTLCTYGCASGWSPKCSSLIGFIFFSPITAHALILLSVMIRSVSLRPCASVLGYPA